MTPFLSRVLITNDDGFDAPGLAALVDVAQLIARDIWIVAPQQDQSGMGQSLTMNGALRCVHRGEQKWAVSGTPADCVILGLSHLMKDNPPELVLSGVNAGNNTGDDANLSGTLGAAFTSLMLGVPAIGMSLDCASRKHLRWHTARAVLPDLLARLWNDKWHPARCVSVNIPDVEPDALGEAVWTHPAPNTIKSFTVEKREDLRERDYFWLYPHSDESDPPEGSDLYALAQGKIALTELTLERHIKR